MASVINRNPKKRSGFEMDKLHAGFLEYLMREFVRIGMGVHHAHDARVDGGRVGGHRQSAGRDRRRCRGRRPEGERRLEPHHVLNLHVVAGHGAVADGEPIFTDLDGVILTGRELENAKKVWEDSGHASGLTFTGTGIYAGKFHGPEEVLSQAATIKGPGIIARAMEALDARTSGQAGRGGDVHIHNQTKFDFAGARFSPDFDMEAFLKMIDARIETGSVEAAKKVIGNRRT